MFGLKNVILGLLVLLLVGFSFADGVLIPDYDHPQIHVPGFPSKNPIQMPEHTVSITLNQQVAHVQVDELFYNDSGMWMEVVYLFAVPKGALISDFRMQVGNQEYKGEIMEADEARMIYNQYVQQARDPALLEYVGTQLIRISIYPFEPYETRRIIINYTQEVIAEGGYYKLVYPLKIDSLLSGTIQKIAITGSIETQDPLYHIYSPSHPIHTQIQPDKRFGTFSFTDTDFVPNQDLILLFGTGQRAFESYFLLHEERAGQGTFMLDFLPSLEVRKPVPKNIVLVVDRSGSMWGVKYEQAIRAAQFVLARLNPQDRFNVILFDSAITLFSTSEAGKAIGAEHAQRAIQWLDRTQPGGMTNIYDALDVAISKVLANTDGNNNYVLFLTDGLPTIGNTNEREILSHAIQMAERVPTTRIFTFGVGYDVNTYILDLLAQETGGLAFYVIEDEDIESVISELYQKITSPVLTDIQVSFSSENIIVMDVVPSRNLVLFQGQPLKIFGRWDGYGALSITLTGDQDGIPYEQVYQFDVLPSYNPYVSMLWAGRRINEIFNLIRLYGENDEMKEEIVRLSKQYGIPTPYTSYLILETEDVDGMGTVPGLPTPMAYDPRAVTSGAGAVQQSKQLNLSAQSQNLFEMEQASAMAAHQGFLLTAGKVFLRDEEQGIWVEEGFQEENVIQIQAYSEAYFDLIAVFPEITEIFVRLGTGPVRFVWEGLYYEVIP